MVIPRGNVLFERESLPYSDINILMSNLEQQGFTGFIKLEAGGPEVYLFFAHGQFLRALEVDETGARINTRARVLNRIKGDVPTSVYVFASQQTQVLASLFAFQPLYRNVEVRKKELKKIRDHMESDEQTGVLELQTREGRHYLLLDQGKIVFNHFSPFYGDVMCGVEEVNRLFDTVGKDGGSLTVYAEKASEIETKRRELEEELERVKVLLAKTESGGIFFKAGDMVRVDEYIVREWGVRTSGSFQIEMETPDGNIYTLPCQPAKKLGGYISVPAKFMKKLQLRDSDPLSVRPIR